MSSSERSPRNRSLIRLRRSKRRPSHSPSPLRGSPAAVPRKVPLLSEQNHILPKCSSEPMLPGTSGSSDGSMRSVSGGWLYRPMTCTNLFSPSSVFHSPDRLLSPHEGYQKDTKVVVTVTVEGSPGPIRTMAKLGSSVEEIIKLVMEKYLKEGRTPKLDKNAASIYDYELHLSYFSLESLDSSDEIGDIGSRNFYLRKGANFDTSRSIASAQANTRHHHQQSPLIVFFPARFTRKFANVVRRMRRLWKVLCLHCS
ncbi:hypothetical protein V2J09_004721 [Rumex salicifolius]